MDDPPSVADYVADLCRASGVVREDVRATCEVSAMLRAEAQALRFIARLHRLERAEPAPESMARGSEGAA